MLAGGIKISWDMGKVNAKRKTQPGMDDSGPSAPLIVVILMGSR
jgi:hypothetical protein